MKIVIAGVGEVGSHLAKMLGSEYHEITVVDNDPKRLESIAGMVDVIVVEGDCTTFATLKKEAVRKADPYIAVLPEETSNVVSAMLAKQLGARKPCGRIAFLYKYHTFFGSNLRIFQKKRRILNSIAK